MHAAPQSGGRPSKSVNSPSLTQHQKFSSENAQNNSQAKGKKRDRSDPSTESVKHENDQLPKAEDGDSVGSKVNDMQAEVFKITQKGGLTFDTVEKLVNLILLDRSEKKIDWAGRLTLATTIAATERYDCLCRFVQLRGITVLDEWLQETQKGKNGDGSSPKGSDKAIEELLLVLLHALDKLPVNLKALQTCNIGKSVNHLRSHKNLEIQRKSRGLIETWKKRVDDEISKFAEPAQAAAWTGKPAYTDAVSRRPGSSDMTMTSFTTQVSENKVLHVKSGHFDFTTKSDPLKVQSAREVHSAITSKDTLCRSPSITTDLPLAGPKEEKSSTSSLSHSNSLSFSDDQTKTMASSSKEDTTNPAGGSMSLCKASGGSVNQRSHDGLLGAATSGVKKETSLDNGNSQRLIARNPSHGCSPARSTNRGSFEDQTTTGSGVSSPSLSTKHDNNDSKVKQRTNGFRSLTAGDANTESWQSNDVKGPLNYDKGDGLPSADFDDEHGRTTEENGKATDVSRNSSGIERVWSSKCKTGNSFSSTNMLIESSSKYSEAGASLPAEDGGGINLLASVAAGEISRSNFLVMSCSPKISSMKDEPCAGKSMVQNHVKSDGSACFDSKRHENEDEQLERNELPWAGTNFSGDNRRNLGLQDNKTAVPLERSPVSSLIPHRTAGLCVKPEGSCTENVGRSCGLYGTRNKEELDRKSIVRSLSPKITPCGNLAGKKIGEGNAGSSNDTCKSVGSENENAAPSDNARKLTVKGSLSCSTDNAHSVANLNNQLQLVASKHTNIADRSGDLVDASWNLDRRAFPKNFNELKSKMVGPLVIDSSKTNDREEKEQTNLLHSSIAAAVGLEAVSADNAIEVEGNVESQDCLPGLANQESSNNFLVKGSEHHLKPCSSKGSADNMCRREELASSAEASSLTVDAETDAAAKVEFDLNEGFFGDDGHQLESATLDAPVCSSANRVPSLSLFISPLQGGASTVSSLSAGIFSPHGNLLKIKSEPGWNGSAATSAFRPAELRKNFEMPLATVDTSLFDSAGKVGQAPLGIDLNVPCEEVPGNMVCEITPQTTGFKASTSVTHGFDLDLNKVDKDSENTEILVSSCRKPGAVAKIEATALRGFDLNGPGVDEGNIELSARSQVEKSASNLQFLTPGTGLRINGAEIGHTSPLLSTSHSYPSVPVPSFLAERGELAHPSVAAPGAERILGSAAGGGTLGSDVYRSLMFSSSAPMGISPATAPYAGFSFGSNFPLASTYVDSSTRPPWFPAFPPHLAGPVCAVSSQQLRPYFFGLPESSSNGSSGSSQKRYSRGLDLNAGPGSTDIEAKGDRMLPASRQVLVASSHASLEEQARAYQAFCASTKRKEPGGGWDTERSAYKQFPWQ